MTQSLDDLDMEMGMGDGDRKLGVFGMKFSSGQRRAWGNTPVVDLRQPLMFKNYNQSPISHSWCRAVAAHLHSRR